jgi:hypothetical protein
MPARKPAATRRCRRPGDCFSSRATYFFRTFFVVVDDAVMTRLCEKMLMQWCDSVVWGVLDEREMEMGRCVKRRRRRKRPAPSSS